MHQGSSLCCLNMESLSYSDSWVDHCRVQELKCECFQKREGERESSPRTFTSFWYVNDEWLCCYEYERRESSVCVLKYAGDIRQPPFGIPAVNGQSKWWVGNLIKPWIHLYIHILRVREMTVCHFIYLYLWLTNMPKIFNHKYKTCHISITIYNHNMACLLVIQWSHILYNMTTC